MIKQYYQISSTGYPIISSIQLDEMFVEYKVGEEPQELLDALSKEQEAQDLQSKLNEAKAYLANTDYIVTKIAEAQALNKDVASLLTIYEDQLLKREEARTFINVNS